MTAFVITLVILYPIIVISGGVILFIKTWKAWHK